MSASSIKHIKVDVNSSLIEYLEYSPEELKMSVKYKSGKHANKVRNYPDISVRDFFHVIESDSIGRAVLKLIQSVREKEYIG